MRSLLESNIFCIINITMKNLFLLIVVGLLICSSNCIPDWSNLEKMVLEAINNGMFPAAAIAVGSSKNIYLNKIWGTYQYRRDVFINNATLDTRWDLDRLSPAVSLVPTFIHLIDNGRVALTDHVSKYEFDFDNNNKKNITIENMMLHNSGFEANYPGVLPKTADEITRLYYCD
jgi:CubicO group peptidase (beta-lactamase class C family)